MLVIPLFVTVSRAADSPITDSAVFLPFVASFGIYTIPAFFGLRAESRRNRKVLLSEFHAEVSRIDPHRSVMFRIPMGSNLQRSIDLKAGPDLWPILDPLQELESDLEMEQTFLRIRSDNFRINGSSAKVLLEELVLASSKTPGVDKERVGLPIWDEEVALTNRGPISPVLGEPTQYPGRPIPGPHRPKPGLPPAENPPRPAARDVSLSLIHISEPTRPY